jgi:hypothetical protein
VKFHICAEFDYEGTLQDAETTRPVPQHNYCFLFVALLLSVLEDLYNLETLTWRLTGLYTLLLLTFKVFGF